MTVKDFTKWWTILIGDNDVKKLREELATAGHYICPWAEKMLDASEFLVQKPTEIDLAVVRVEELGFQRAKTQDIYDRAKKLGLGLCPVEVGPVLRRAFTNQRLGQEFNIAMRPIGRRQEIFLLEHRIIGGHSALSAKFGAPGDWWEPFQRFVFVRPRGG